MRSAFGHIRKQPNGSYRVYWSRGGVRQSKQLRSYKEATQLLAKKCLEAGNVPTNITYNEYYDTIIKDTYKDLESRTITQYETSWHKHLKPVIGNMKIADTNWRLVQTTIDEFSCHSTQRRALAWWRRTLNYAMRDEIIPNNVCTQKIKLKKPNKRIKRLYDKNQLKKVLEQIRGTRYGLAVLIMCVCGLRFEEYLGLNKRDFDYKDEGWVYISVNKALTMDGNKKVLKDVKTANSRRIVALHRDFALYLSDHSQFMTNKRTLKEYLNGHSFNRNWKNYCERHNIDYVPFGDMRSVYATLSAEAGCLDSIVSKSMGHSGRDVKERNYQSVTMQALKLNATQLAEYIDYNDYREF